MKLKVLVFIAGIVGFIASPALAQMGAGGASNTPRLNTTDRFVPVIGRNGMVTSREKMASQVGADILEQGGNAVDAAVAVGFALAVTYPQAGNIGGGGFMVIHMAEENKSITIDYREMAP
ncbi:MAG: gamma-glutamyltransferase, partial [Emcibacteraceae bacterium]|nr:gamma-glutamyltransferase [Emcibacteraceae bacterium]